MVLRLYNTLTKQKEALEGLPGFDGKNVRMYVCGPTVYDFAHIGNARPAIVFDVLFRLLRHVYGAEHVTYVRNITDVDDKIIKAADEKGVPIDEITRRTAQQYFDDVAALGCLSPTYQPRATEYVGQMVAMIKRLIASGHAYLAEGHVLYDVSSKEDYGKLARRSLDEMIAGARVEVAPYKKNPMDFVLWKPSPPQLPGWQSPWGRGRPGWHIECSAMSEALLGETFDIHGGGIDLVFPHHENEIAQSEGVHNCPLARIWMHNGFLQVEGEKMSKSLGNFVTIKELRENWNGYGWPGEALRFNMLRTHYRQPIDWTFEGLDESHRVLRELSESAAAESYTETSLPLSFLEAICDDMNTPQTITELHSLRRQGDIKGLLAALRFLGFSGDPQKIVRTRFLTLEATSKVKASLEVLGTEEIETHVLARNAARKAKNFKEADRIRDELLAKGIVLKDGPTGTTWEVKR